MLVGYNTNVPYKGILYHVQTEDNGLKNPVIITLLYDKGVILASKKTGYAELATRPDYKEKVRELMKDQHKNMIKGLIHGDFAEAIAKQQPVAAPAAAAEKPAAVKKQEIRPEVRPAAEKERPVVAPAKAGTSEVNPPAPKDQMLKDQMLKDQRLDEPGKEDQGKEEQAPKKQISGSLDDILLDFILKGGK